MISRKVLVRFELLNKDIIEDYFSLMHGTCVLDCGCGATFSKRNRMQSDSRKGGADGIQVVRFAVS